MAQAREYELKFEIGGGDVAVLLAHPALAAAARRRRTSQLVATYFDTPDHRLRRRGLSLRVRDADGRRQHTVKRIGASFVDRGEWTVESDEPVPDIARLGKTPVERLPRGIKRDIGAVFTVAVQRTCFVIGRGTTQIEVAIDRGDIDGGGRRLPVCEFELELKAGEPAVLFDLARRLVSDMPLSLSLTSKAERGYGLCDGSWGHPGKGHAASLRPGMTPESAFRAIAHACLHHLLANLALLAGPADIELVHQARIAVRRLRAAMTLFKPRVRGQSFAPLRIELKWMSDLLGRARDSDVMQSEMFDPAAAGGTIFGADALSDRMRADQDRAHAALAAAVASPRWRAFLVDFVGWIEGYAPATDEKDGGLTKFVGARLETRRKSITKKGADLANLTPAARHRLRIEAKKLRYAMLFFDDMSCLGRGSKAYRTLLHDLGVLQSALGHLHDYETKQHVLRDAIMAWDGKGDGRAIFAAGALSALPVSTEAPLAKAKSALRRSARCHPFR